MQQEQEATSVAVDTLRGLPPHLPCTLIVDIQLIYGLPWWPQTITVISAIQLFS